MDFFRLLADKAAVTSTQPTVKLNNDVEMPVLGLGVYQVGPGRETEDAVKHAISTGYRHIDTARFYRNERSVGKAIRESGIPREEVFVTTKLANSDHGYEATLKACTSSLAELGFSYVDLYLIHWPVEGLRRDSWRAMEQLLRDGKCRAIGVSNYTVRHLNELLADAAVVPAVDQVELSPFLYQRDILRFAEEHRIQIEAYSPLTQGVRLDHRSVVAIAKKHERSPAQILLRWAVQHKMVVIPKSTKPHRIAENARIFDFQLGPDDLETLDGLNEDLHTCWDPTRAR